MPVWIWQAPSESLENELQHCVGLWMAKSLLRNEWPWAIQIGSHVILMMANEWVTDTQHLKNVSLYWSWFYCVRRWYGTIWKHWTQPQVKKIKAVFFLAGWIQSVWSKSLNKNISLTIFLCICWKDLQRAVFLCVCAQQIESVWGFSYLLMCIQRSRRRQEILVNGKAVCLCQIASVSYTQREKERERGHRRLELQRINFISLDRLNGRYLSVLQYRIGGQRAFHSKTLRSALLPADADDFIPFLSNLFKTHCRIYRSFLWNISEMQVNWKKWEQKTSVTGMRMLFTFNRNL